MKLQARSGVDLSEQSIQHKHTADRLMSLCASVCVGVCSLFSLCDLTECCRDVGLQEDLGVVGLEGGTETQNALAVLL